METTKGSEMQTLQVNHETLGKQVTVVFSVQGSLWPEDY